MLGVIKRRKERSERKTIDDLLARENVEVGAATYKNHWYKKHIACRHGPLHHNSKPKVCIVGH